MSTAYSIYYDMQKNSFYRMNKQTGDSVRSYLNGEDLPKFTNDVTGFKSKRKQNKHFTINLRRKHSQSAHSPTDTNQQSFQNATINLTMKTTINPSLSRNRLYENEDNKNRNIIMRYRNIKSLIEKKNSVKEDFEDKANRYEQILANRIKNNHSPKQHIDGSSDKKDILQTLCIRKQQIARTIDVSSFEESSQRNQGKKVSMKRKIRQANLNQQYNVQKQIKKQRIFFKTLSEDKQKERIQQKRNSSIEREKIKRKNLKELEKHMLDKNRKAQMQIPGIACN